MKKKLCRKSDTDILVSILLKYRKKYRYFFFTSIEKKVWILQNNENPYVSLVLTNNLARLLLYTMLRDQKILGDRNHLQLKSQLYPHFPLLNIFL